MRDFNVFDGLFASLTFGSNQDMNGIQISNVVFAGTLLDNTIFDDFTRLDLCWPIGDTLIQSDDAEEWTSEIAYTKYKQMTLTGNANLRVKFDLKSENVAGVAFGKIYINGEPVGTERTDTDDVYTTYSEDFNNCHDGDTIELWMHYDGTFNAYIRNFRVYIASDTTPSLTVDVV